LFLHVNVFDFTLPTHISLLFSLHEALGSCSVACLAVAGDIVPVCPNVAQDI
jgi:hypothetical protein